MDRAGGPADREDESREEWESRAKNGGNARQDGGIQVQQRDGQHVYTQQELKPEKSAHVNEEHSRESHC